MVCDRRALCCFHVNGTCALGFISKEEGREGGRGREEGDKGKEVRKKEAITRK